MPFDGSGNFTRAMNWVSDATAGIKILASRHDTEDNNFASGLSNVICKDGQSSPTADIPMNGQRLINVGAPINPTDAATKNYADSIKTFTTGIVIPGTDSLGMVTFTAPTGSEGLLWTEAGATDMFYGVTHEGVPAGHPNRWVWNNGAANVGVLSDGGNFGVAGSGYGFNSYFNGSSWVAMTAGFTGMWAFQKAFGYYELQASSASAAANTVPTYWRLLQVTPTDATFRGNIKLHDTPTHTIGIVGSLYTIGTGPGSNLNYNTVSGSWKIETSYALQMEFINTVGISMPYSVANKAGGGPWGATSDARIKTVSADYTTGLDAVLALRPVVYTYKGNDTPEPPAYLEGDPDAKETLTAPYPNSMHRTVAERGTEFVGLVAQEVEPVMPDMVRQKDGYIDGQPVSDLRDLDTSNLIYALVNAVKQLSARIEALEAGT